jgi:hypothetical protein
MLSFKGFPFKNRKNSSTVHLKSGLIKGLALGESGCKRGGYCTSFKMYVLQVKSFDKILIREITL